MFLNIFTPYRYYYNAITANCNDFWERLEVLEVLVFFGKYLQSGKKQYVIKVAFQNIQNIQNTIYKKIHGNSRKSKNIQCHL